MKVIINQELIRKSWSGKSFLNKTIITTKENIVNKVNDYISERIHIDYLIPIKCFHVNIYNHNGKLVDKWEYKPTYR